MIITKESDIKSFEKILSDAVNVMGAKSKASHGAAFEKELLEVLNSVSEKTHFDGTYEITGKLTFPDIVSKLKENGWIGVEVKTSQKDWKCFGNSIFETTRPEEVDSVFLFFAKIDDKVECKWSKYSDCIDNINITHSPRYQINMEISGKSKDATVFDKMGVSYDDFRKLSPDLMMSHIRKLKRKQLGDKVALWWLNEKPSEDTFSIKLFNKLNKDVRSRRLSEALVLFPEIITSKNRGTKYNNFTTWLISDYGVVSPSTRDLFTAGGVVNYNINGINYDLPKIFGTINKYASTINEILNSDDRSFIGDRWKVSGKNLKSSWIDKIHNDYNLNVKDELPVRDFLIGILR